MMISDISWLGSMVYQDGNFTTVGHARGTANNRLVPILSGSELLFCTETDNIAGVIIGEDLLSQVKTGMGIIISSSPYRTAAKILDEVNPDSKNDVEKPSVIHCTARIHPTAIIAGNNVSIGRNCVIGEYVTVHSGTFIGDNTSIGSHGEIGVIPLYSGLDPESDTEIMRGSVFIGDGVSIHSNCIIERPVFFDTTRIGRCCQIDSQVIIRQGAEIGDYSLLAAIVEIDEYSIIGKGCWVGPRGIINKGVKIGDSCYVTLGSDVHKNMKPGMIIRDNWSIKKDRFKGIIP